MFVFISSAVHIPFVTESPVERLVIGLIELVEAVTEVIGVLPFVIVRSPLETEALAAVPVTVEILVTGLY